MADLSHIPSYANIHQIGPGATRPGDRPVVPEVSPPTLPEMGEYPKYDESAVRAGTQRAAAPGIRTLREAYQTAAARLPSGPQTRLTLKDALRGYGSGLESVMAGAGRQARGEYAQKYAAEVRPYEMEFQARVQMEQQRANLEQQRMLKEYESTYQEFIDEPQTPGPGSETGMVMGPRGQPMVGYV